MNNAELDKAAAVAMGWPTRVDGIEPYGHFINPGHGRPWLAKKDYRGVWNGRHEAYSPTSDGNHWMMFVKWMSEQGFDFEYGYDSSFEPVLCANFHQRGSAMSFGESAELSDLFYATIRAGLNALEQSNEQSD